MISMHDMTDEEVRIRGLEAVRRELGTAGLFRFLRQFGLCQGDYSVERHQWMETLSLRQILDQIERARDLSTSG